MTIVERRKFPRFSLAVKVQYQILESSYPREKEAQSKNISAGGIRLAVPEKVNIGDLLRLKLSLPGEASAITVRGKVIWVEEFSVSSVLDDKAYDCGIEFVDISAEDQEHISRYVTFSLKQ